MRRRPRIREGLLKALEELDHFVSAPQHPGLGPGRRQSILELIGERGVGGFHITRVPGSIPLLERHSERAKELGLNSWHRPRSISRKVRFPCKAALLLFVQSETFTWTGSGTCALPPLARVSIPVELIPADHFPLGVPRHGHNIYVAPDAEAIIVRAGSDWGVGNQTWLTVFRDLTDQLADRTGSGAHASG